MSHKTQQTNKNTAWCFWVNTGSGTPSKKQLCGYLHPILQNHPRKMDKIWWVLLEAKMNSKVKLSFGFQHMDTPVLADQQTLISSVLYWHQMLAKEPPKSNGWSGWIGRKSQKNPHYQYDLMVMIYIYICNIVLSAVLSLSLSLFLSLSLSLPLSVYLSLSLSTHIYIHIYIVVFPLKLFLIHSFSLSLYIYIYIFQGK